MKFISFFVTISDCGDVLKLTSIKNIKIFGYMEIKNYLCIVIEQLYEGRTSEKVVGEF
jgi:hypothetical protein